MCLEEIGVLLTDNEIKRAVNESEIIIEPFDEKCLKSASYDMRLGDEGFTSSGAKKIDIKRTGTLIIEAGDFAVVTTYEKIKLNNIIAGHIGLRSYFTRKGLIPLSGPQIDPGFNGRLIIGLFNASPRDIVIPYKEEFCTVEFYRLNEEVQNIYSGEYQNQERIPVQDIENMIAAKGMSFGEVIKTLSALSEDVKEMGSQVKNLADTVSNMKWLIGGGIGIIGILAGISLL